ncbi:MAG: VanZ family protein [Terriglobia bacterium]
MFAAWFLRFSRRAAQWLLLPALAIVVWGELTPHPPEPVDVWDKLLHFIAYFGLSGIALVAFRPGRRAIYATSGLIFAGGVLEIVQGMVGRDASWGDELANTLGAVTGCLLGWAIVRLLERAARGQA